MLRTGRRRIVGGVGCALLAAIVLCPLMATAAATPAASSCHDRPQDHHGDTSAAFTCCATVVVKPSVPAASEADAAPVPAVEGERYAAPHIGWHADHPRPQSVSPRLFLRHASLLI
ncbi:MAG: hypothetical protein OXG04_20905 [Acidobacteria bacterium]|nr:hypothetical protein [Acidobacteriota bacterium]